MIKNYFKYSLKIGKKDPGPILTQENLLVHARYRQIHSRVNEKIVKVLKFSHFGSGYLASNGCGQQMNRSVCLENSLSSIDKASLKTNAMLLSLVLLEEKLFN